MNKIIFRLVINNVILCLCLVNLLLAYSISVKEPMFGILYRTSIIDNIHYIHINNRFITIEINNESNTFKQSWPCQDVISIKDDEGAYIKFNCEKLHDDIILGESKQINNFDNRSIEKFINPKENILKDEIIRMGYRYRIEFKKSDIIIEKNKITIYTTGRRTNIESTLIKCYWLCGYAMDVHNANYDKIYVIINIDKGRGEKFTSAAEGEDVKKLGESRSPGISSFSGFLNKLTINRNK